MPLRLALGLGITAVMFAIAGRRFFWLYQPDLGRAAGGARPVPATCPSGSRPSWSRWAARRSCCSGPSPALAHAFTFWGFTILFLTIIEAYGCLFQRDFHIPLIGHTAVIGFLEDFFAVAVHRLPAGLRGHPGQALAQAGEPAVPLLRLAHRGRLAGAADDLRGDRSSLLLYRAAQVNTGNFPYGWWAFASHGLANALKPLGTGVNSVIETVALLANIAIITGFLVFVSYSKHLHIFLAPINVATSRRPRALGALASTPDMSMEDVGDDDEVVFGAGRIEDFSWKQLLDMATCTECGRCQSQCPAWNTGKPLSPKLLIMDLRDNLFASADRVMAKNRAAGVEVENLVPSVIDPDVLWSCTTCGACVEQCPVDIEHIDTIIDMRRYEVLMESKFPTEAGLMLRNIENQGDPWGLGSSKRTDWIDVARLRGAGHHAGPSPTTSSTSTGSAVPAPSTSGPARARRPPPACSTGPGSPSASSGPRSRAPATRRAGWATSTSTRSRPG